MSTFAGAGAHAPAALEAHSQSATASEIVNVLLPESETFESSKLGDIQRPQTFDKLNRAVQLGM